MRLVLFGAVVLCRAGGVVVWWGRCSYEKRRHLSRGFDYWFPCLKRDFHTRPCTLNFLFLYLCLSLGHETPLAPYNNHRRSADRWTLPLRTWR